MSKNMVRVFGARHSVRSNGLWAARGLCSRSSPLGTSVSSTARTVSAPMQRQRMGIMAARHRVGLGEFRCRRCHRDECRVAHRGGATAVTPEARVKASVKFTSQIIAILCRAPGHKIVEVAKPGDIRQAGLQPGAGQSSPHDLYGLRAG